MVNYLRRSERIKEKLARKKRLQTQQENSSSKNSSVSCPVNGRKKGKKNEQKRQELQKPMKKSSSIFPTGDMSDNKVAECIKGVMYMNEERIVSVKWKGIEKPEFIEEKCLDLTLKEMLKSFLDKKLQKLSDDLDSEESLPGNSQSINYNLKKERRYILEFKNQQRMCLQDQQLVNNCDYMVDVKLGI